MKVEYPFLHATSKMIVRGKLSDSNGTRIGSKEDFKIDYIVNSERVDCETYAKYISEKLKLANEKVGGLMTAVKECLKIIEFNTERPKFQGQKVIRRNSTDVVINIEYKLEKAIDDNEL